MRLKTAHLQDDVNLHILRMLEGTFSLDGAQIMCDKCVMTKAVLRLLQTVHGNTKQCKFAIRYVYDGRLCFTTK